MWRDISRRPSEPARPRSDQVCDLKHMEKKEAILVQDAVMQDSCPKKKMHDFGAGVRPVDKRKSAPCNCTY